MVLISKPFEVKATVDGMSLRFPFRVCRGLQPPKALACTEKRNTWSPADGFLQKMKYLGDLLTKDVATRELEPAKSAYAEVEFNMMPATVYVASTFV